MIFKEFFYQNKEHHMDKVISMLPRTLLIFLAIQFLSKLFLTWFYNFIMFEAEW